MNRGSHVGQELIPAAVMDQMHTPIEPPPIDPPAKVVPQAPIDRYAMGWFVRDHAGQKVVEHAGVKNGFVAWMAFMPRQRHGLVVFSNHHQSGINSALRFWIFDRLLGRPDKDWSRIVQRDYTQGGHRLLREAKAKFAAPHPVKQPPVFPIADFLGTYKSRICRSIHVSEKNGQLLLKCGTRFNGEMKTWHGNSFRVFFSNPQLHDWLVTFNTRDQQAISLRVQEAPWAPDWYDDRDDLGEFVKQ